MAENKIFHVVVLGAGFGGLEFCKHFRRPNARMTLVDRKNHHLFQPLLYQVATAGLSAPEIAQPVRAIFSNRPDITVLLDTVVDFDLANKKVLLEENTLDLRLPGAGVGQSHGIFRTSANGSNSRPGSRRSMTRCAFGARYYSRLKKPRTRRRRRSARSC